MKHVSSSFKFECLPCDEHSEVKIKFLVVAMIAFKMLLLCAGLSCCIISNVMSLSVDHVKNWGDLSKQGSPFIRTAEKSRIPFVTREMVFSYPDVSVLAEREKF